MNGQSKPLNNSLFSYLLTLLPPVSLHKGAFIAGGCARKLYENTPWIQGDVDVFFAGDWERARWAEQLVSKIASLPKQDHPHVVRMNKIDENLDESVKSILHLMQNHAPEPPQLPSLIQAVSTDNADSYHLVFVDPEDANKVHTCQIQVIKTRYAHSIQDLWQEFDFTVSCFAVDANEIWAAPQAIADLGQKKLVLNNDENTKNLVMRVFKHHVYGFEVDDELLIHVADKIAEGDFEWNSSY